MHPCIFPDIPHLRPGEVLYQGLQSIRLRKHQEYGTGPPFFFPFPAGHKHYAGTCYDFEYTGGDT